MDVIPVPKMVYSSSEIACRTTYRIIVRSSAVCKIAWHLSLIIMPCTLASRPVPLAPKWPQNILIFFT